MAELDLSAMRHDFWSNSGPHEANRRVPTTKPKTRKPISRLQMKWPDRSFLSRLPREVRDQIYSYLLPPERRVSIGNFNAVQLEKSLKKLQTVDRSGRLHREALQLYFRTRTLIFCRRLDFCFAWRTIMQRMRLYGIDLHEEVRQVEICAWSRAGGKLAKRTTQKWALTRDAVKMCVRFLKGCTLLNSLNICVDVNYLFLEEVRPLLGVDCKKLSFEIDLEDKIEKWTPPRDCESLEKLFAESESGTCKYADARVIHVRTLIAGAVKDALAVS